MITKENFKNVLEQLDFYPVIGTDNTYQKIFGDNTDNYFSLTATFKDNKVLFQYPNGITMDRSTTVDDHQKESYVVFECVARLFDVGYRPENITLEGINHEGHDQGWIDILVKDNDDVEYLIIECKTSAEKDKKEDEFEKHWKRTLNDGDQLFRYFNTYSKAQFLCLYTADFVDEKLTDTYHVITLKDNEDYLKSNKKLKSYKTLRENQGSKEEFFEVWKNTYLQDYSTNGIFESDCKPFDIGQKKFSIDDLKEIDSNSMQKKYNEFATILRKYNVSSKENAFDKLINLFLAKIVDETNNQSELKCLWKGAAYDNYFDMQDRLLSLYKIGMEKFFKEDVAYIENDEIENAFKFLKNADEEDVAKKTIFEYFRILKYYNNNPFAFLDVHNEKLFYQNAVILKEIVNMVQDIRIKTEEQNQFLGDLFEGFLDQGIKQSEGQFFTPLPIVKFLISSLPLDSIISESKDIPKVIDYACGAGHFLTEYANQIKPIVKKHNKAEIENYYANIFGIEKEYRLSKVSQVSAFMYGQNEIKILYRDALAHTPEVQEGTYSVLIANPPYSVKGFLETLSEEDRESYELYNSDLNVDTNNSIETFFVERAKQLLKKDGIAAIILPSSVLSNGNIYIKCREIILKYFDLVAIFESGSGTFGKTGTNTATLFMRRREDTPSLAEQYENRVNTWFGGNFDYDRVYEDFDKVAKYCSMQNYPLEDYKKFLAGELTEELLKNEIFAEYKKTFENDTNAKNILKKKITPKYTEENKRTDFEKYVFEQIKQIEKDKLYYYMLASTNQDVLVIKSPSDNKEIKKFLGYEWSASKGNEGIKYLGSVVDDEENQLQKNKGIEGIQTPLFNPEDFDDATKLNYFVRKNFMNADEITIPQELQQFAGLVPLCQMIDFSRTGFDKAIKTKLKVDNGELKIQSKYPLVKLGEVAPYVSEKIDFSEITIQDYISTDNMLQNKNGVVQYSGEPNIDRIIKYLKDDILISNIRPYLKKIWLADKNGGCSNDVIVFRVKNNNQWNVKYLYELLSQDNFFDFMMAGNKGIKMPRGDKNIIPSYKIPLPPKDIQERIVSECEKIDLDFENAKKRIEDGKREIEEIMEESQKNATLTYRLSNKDVFEVSIGSRILSKEINENYEIPVFSANVFKSFGKINKLLLEEFDRPSVIWGIDGDWMVNVIPQNQKFYPTDHCGVLRIKDKQLEEKYVAWVLNKEGKNQGFRREYRASIDRIEGITIKLPSLAQQKEIVAQITALEEKIAAAKKTISECPAKKAAILKKWLEN